MMYIDLYCERVGPEMLAEPFNAFSNGAFFVAAWLLWRRMRQHDAWSSGALPLITLIVAIGIGSSLFHTYAQGWARVLDELPILLFQLVFIWVYSHRVIRLRSITSTALVAIFLVAALYGRQFPHLLIGSLTYAPAFVALLLLGIFHHQTRQPAPWMLIGAAGVFLVALLFRTVDAAVCPLFPIGTHFLWHLIIPVVLYLCVWSLFVSLATPDALSSRISAVRRRPET